MRVNCIRPGLIRTELVAPVLDSPELSADYAACTPLPRPGEVEDIANAAVFLLSDAASYVTGQVINVDGGLMLRRGPGLLGDARARLRRRRAARRRARLAAGRIGGTGLPGGQCADRRPVQVRAAAGQQGRGSDRASGWPPASAPADSSAAASTRRMSFWPSDAANPAGSNCSPAISPPYVL